MDSTITLWDVGRRTQLATLSGHTGSADAVAFSPDGRMLASGGENELILWDVAARAQFATLPAGAGGSNMAFSPDGRTLDR
jgi:WD40 repeat protein